MIGEGTRLSSSPLVLPKELSQSKCKCSCYCSIFTAMLTFGFTCGVILVVIFSWFGLFRNGFSWDPKTTLFNFHPTFMTLGSIVLPTLAILSYRIFPIGKWPQKIIHWSINLISQVSICIALVAIEQSKFTSNHTHFWSIHSWCGLLTLIAINLQFTLGILYLFPTGLQRIKDLLISWHRFFGLFIIWIATVTILAGVSEYLNTGVSSNWMNYGKNYTSYAPEGIVGNVFCIFVIINSSLLTIVLVGPMNKYLPKTEE